MSKIEDKHTEEPIGLFQVMLSVLAGAFGVQSSENRKRDFARGRPLQFVITGIIFTVIFVVGMAALVNSIITSAG